MEPGRKVEVHLYLLLSLVASRAFPEENIVVRKFTLQKSYGVNFLMFMGEKGRVSNIVSCKVWFCGTRVSWFFNSQQNVWFGDFGLAEWGKYNTRFHRNSRLEEVFQKNLEEKETWTKKYFWWNTLLVRLYDFIV